MKHYMNSIIKLTTLLSAMTLTLVACEKTDNPAGGNTIVTPVAKERTIIYAVSNSENRQALKTEAEWDAMLERFCDQAAAGSDVVFYNMDQTTYLHGSTKGLSKENHTINTTSREEMKAWMKEMEKEGRTVRVSYDEGSGTWHGEAYATAPANNTLGILVDTWHFNCMVVSHVGTDGQLLGSDLYVPDENGGAMYYTFDADGNVTMTMYGVGGTTATDSASWTLSDDGVLCSDLMPNGGCWNVNWATPNTMILSREELGTDEGDLYYQLQFTNAAE